MQLSTTLTEEAYRAIEAISASDLCEILKCPAKWRYREKTETKAMELGTAAHAALLEQERFSAAYYREAESNDWEPPALDTVAEIKKYLADAGIKAPSGAGKDELAYMAANAGATVLCVEQERDRLAAELTGAQALAPKDYDKIQAMRGTIYAQPEYSKALTGAAVEVSITGVEYMGVTLKARLDVVTANGELWDYKTTTDASPDAFGRSAHNYDYWLKMAFYHDMFAAAYGQTPARTVLLAQEKESPYLCQAYALTKEQLQAGRTAYQMALGIYARCLESGNWPAYGGGVQELQTPNWLKGDYQQ